jgi:hypothetical protein
MRGGRVAPQDAEARLTDSTEAVDSHRGDGALRDSNGHCGSAEIQAGSWAGACGVHRVAREDSGNARDSMPFAEIWEGD